MAFSYWLPDEQGNRGEYQTESNAVIIIGANGAGKSKLGAWMEQQDFPGIHRVGAQRNLNFGDSIPLKSYSDAENIVFYGTNSEDRVQNNDKGFRWEWGKSYTTKLLDDFGDVLAALLALNNNEIASFFDLCRKAERENHEKPSTPQTVLDKMMQIWKDVLPQRDIVVDDSIKQEQEIKFQTVLQGNSYTDVIKVFNKKSVVSSVGHFFGINNNEYCTTVIALLRGEKHDAMVDAFSRYLPTDIPR